MNFQPFCYQTDIVFEGRNKAYGAYSLRKIYEKRILISVAIAILAFVVGMGGPVLYSSFIGVEKVDPNLKKANLIALEPPPVDKKTPPPPEIPPPPPPPKVDQIKFLPPEPKKDKDVKEDEMPPIEKVKETNISDRTEKGVKEELPPTPPSDLPPPTTTETTKEDPNQIYTVVQVNAKYNGDMGKFMRKNFKYPKNAQRMGIEGRVFVRFVVRKDGTVDDVTVTRGISNCPECNEEAMRLVRLMAGWAPAQQNGNAVNVYFSLPIVFKLEQ